MITEHYDEFKRLRALRRDEDAKGALKSFIDSFRDDDERRTWARWFLANESIGHKVRHELYRDVVFPTLIAAYRLNEAWAYRELARTAQNLYSSPDLWAQIENKTTGAILRELLNLEPEDRRTQQLLLQENLNGLQYAVHEWPAGILFGFDGATLEQCEELLAEIKESAQWTTEPTTLHFLSDVENKVRLYMDRLTNHSAPSDGNPSGDTS